MKRILYLVLMVAGVFALPLALQSEEPPSAELLAQGEKLFNAKEGLGVKFACILCHKNEKAVKRSHVIAAGDKLPDVINKYVTTKSKGKPLAKDSAEMKALAAYILHKHSK